MSSSKVFHRKDEPYRARRLLKELDEAVSKSMTVYRQLSPRTFQMELTPLQVAAAQIVPQAMSIALSMRELVRQAYLFPAGVLMRPLAERVGTVYFLSGNTSAVDDWHDGWQRKKQPTLQQLIDLALPPSSSIELDETRQILNKFIHTDPASALLNLSTRSDGISASAAGQEINEPVKADAVCLFVTVCLRRLTRVSVQVFAPAH